MPTDNQISNLAQRSVTSAGWNMISSLSKVVILFFRSVLLARWLPVETFGIYAWAGSIVLLTSVLPNFGMGGAFVHRSEETADEDHAAAIHFSLKSLFTAIWAIILMTGTVLFTGSETRTALIVLTLSTAGLELAHTPRLILNRRVAHRRLALIEVACAVATTLAALILAQRGVTLWALLATDLVTLFITIWALYIWRPVWRPHFAWKPSTVRYYIHFGARNFLATILQGALDRVDDLWTGYSLGSMSLGFYSRAYTFATYPRRILASPINSVSSGTYAALKGDRRRLSHAFFQTNAFLVRSGFFLAGGMALVAPEFIRIVLTDKWMPMLEAFRLMLIFTLFDPIQVTVSSMFVAIGEPGRIIKARGIQLIVLLAGLIILGSWWGITGIALAVDIMLAVGIILLLWQSREFVDFSIARLFGLPIITLFIAMGVARASLFIPGVTGNDWRTGLIQGLIFTMIYAGLLIIFERHDLVEMVKYLPLPEQIRKHIPLK